MIYRALIEGGNTSLTKPIDDAFYVFFSAHTRDEARSRLEVIFNNLFPGEGHQADWYDCCNLHDEVELKRDALEPEVFPDAFLVETGCRGEDPSYAKDAIMFVVGEDRQRVRAALEQGHRANQALKAKEPV